MRSTVIFVYDGVQVLDVAGPAQALTTANEEGAKPGYGVRLVAMAPGPVNTASGLSLMAHGLPRTGDIDTIFVPGGPGIHALRQDKRAIRALAGLFRRTRRISAVCTGAFMLAEMGLLANRRAVTHWRSCARLAREFPDIDVDPEPLFIRSDHIWTTAGVTAGIDLTLSLIEDDHGAAIASRVARRLVVYMRRLGGQRQYSEPLALQEVAAAPYDKVIQMVTARPSASWTINDLATAAGQSARSFHRKFSSATGVTPGLAVEKVRCELARTLIQTTRLKLAQISVRVGFGSESAMRRALHRQFGVSPNMLRGRF